MFTIRLYLKDNENFKETNSLIFFLYFNCCVYIWLNIVCLFINNFPRSLFLYYFFKKSQLNINILCISFYFPFFIVFLIRDKNYFRKKIK